MPAVVGVQLLGRVSGLPPDALLFSLTHFNARDSDIVAAHRESTCAPVAVGALQMGHACSLWVRTARC